MVAKQNKSKSAIADLAITTQKAEAEAKNQKGAHRTAVEEEKTKHVDLLRCVAEEWANFTDAALKTMQADLEKLRVKLQQAKLVAEETKTATTKAFEAGEMSTKEQDANEALKFKNRGFKHDWLKALTVAKVTLEIPIPYEQEEMEPLESDPKQI